MNAAQIIENQPVPALTASGELTAVPARVANDNGYWPAVGLVRDPLGFEVVGLPRVYPCLARGAPGDTRPLTNMPPVIAVTGPAGSGKSTVSDYLATRYGYTKTKFAEPLKSMMRALGLTDAQIEGDFKETPAPQLGMKTPRYAMQTLGTEWGRKCMGEDFWLDLWAINASMFNRVIVDDCRFPNEAAAVRRMGGRVIRLDGRGGIAGSHVSEAGCGIADEVICNDGSVADLHTRVRQVLEGWA